MEGFTSQDNMKERTVTLQDNMKERTEDGRMAGSEMKEGAGAGKV
jgi:hypothetical protein